MALRILHFADIHARDNDINEIAKCLDAVFQAAMIDIPDLIVCAGDVFDSQNVKLDSKSAKLIFSFFSQLADIAPVAVVIGTPSHDGTAAEVLRHIKAKYQVWVSPRPEQFLLVISAGQGRMFIEPRMLVKDDSVLAVITMVPTPTKQFFNSDSDIKGSDNEIAQAMSAMFAGFGAQASEFHGVPHIVVGHFAMGGAFISETQQLNGLDIEISREQIGYANADLSILGHIHLHQQIGHNIYYSGSIFRKDFGELDDKGFYIHEIDDTGGTSSRFMHTPTRKLVKILGDFTSDRNVETAGAFVLAQADQYGIYGAHVRVELKCYQDEAVKISKTEIEAILAGAAEIDIRIIRIPRENVRSAHILKLFTLREKLGEMAALKAETVPDSILAKADVLENMTPDQVMAASISGLNARGIDNGSPGGDMTTTCTYNVGKKTIQVLDLNSMWPIQEVEIAR